ncbi:Histidine kinase-like ATPase domain-containing protein [Streptomyces sp. DvalAA-14]|uniref:ATP-binding protein n=1 Tax=unclassified Streptomyces TaxID=2593676 RepID=UPI00081B85D8|nr:MULTISPECIES: ATP-binding protein [unclassified Streptomyces]MYS21318.1 ATP-binding protein [Streptomyces sp. SID4948]SCD89680.1 Histidine kinase-like ATPase domain-containing protein [Streptomyces sp. DvalAA-14]
MTHLLQDPAFWCLIAAVLIGAVIIRRGRRVIAAQRAELTQWENRLANQAADHAKSVSDAETAAEERTKTVLKSATRTLQGLAGEQQVVIENLQRKYGGHPVLHELLEVNHANAQFARRAQAIAVICGGFLGRRKDAASVYDVIRSAQGQIRNFDRVHIRSQSAFGIEAKAISGISLAVAELLANAANYSRPDTAIEVNIQPVHNGLCVIIDDFGVGMSDEQRQKAGRMLSGEYIPAMSELGNPPQFGFPVIAELSRRYGFSVDVSSTSPYGGVRAVVRLPEDLLTEQSVEPAKAAPSVISPVAAAARPAEATPLTANGLPKRAARQSPMSIVRVPASTEHEAPSEDDSAVAAARMAALQQGTRSGRQPTAAYREGSDPQ